MPHIDTEDTLSIVAGDIIVESTFNAALLYDILCRFTDSQRDYSVSVLGVQSSLTYRKC